MTQSLIFDTIGILGAACYLSAYGAVQFGYLDGNSRLYTALNTFAAAFVLVSLTVNFNAASAVIQIAWLSIGLGSLCLRRR